MSKIDRNMGNIFACLAEILLGVLLFINPVGFTTGVLVLLGVLLAIIGIAAIVGYFRTPWEEAARGSGLARGLLCLCVSFVCLFRTEWVIAFFPLITVFYGIVILVGGISKLQWAIDLLRAKQKYWYVALIGAGASLLFALVILLNPFTSTDVLWSFIAVSLIVAAVLDILTFIFGKR